jgi:hypothetical protein
MKLQNQITSLVVSTAFALANANSVGGPGYAAYNGNNYRQQGQQQGQEGWHGQPRHQTYGQQPEMTVEEDATEEPPLPSGWSEHFDPNSGQYYYYNSEDGTTTWDKPVTESSDVQLQNENDGKGDMVEGGLTSQKVEEAVPVSEAKDFRAEDVSQQGNQEGQSYGQNSWGVQDASRTPDNRQSDDWEAKKQSQPLLQQEEQLDPLISTNTENLKDTLQPQSQPQEWNGNRVQQQQERQGGVQGTGSFDGQRPSQQFPERQEQGSGSGSPPPSGGWGLPNDQTSPQPSQRSSEWMDPTRDQSQLQSALGVARANVQNNESEQPQNQNLKDQPRPSTPQWGVPNPAKQGGDVPRPEGARPLSPNNTMPAPRAFTRHTVEQPVGHYPQHQSSTDRPPTNKIQDAGQGQQQVPPIGQIPPQAQRPTYGSGQANQYGQPPIQRFDGQYPHYNSPQQYGQYGGQHPGYGQQVVGESGSTLEDSTAVVKDALGKSWQGILGFSNRTRDAMGQARDQVVTGASAASQTLSEKSTSKCLSCIFQLSLNPIFCPSDIRFCTFQAYGDKQNRLSAVFSKRAMMSHKHHTPCPISTIPTRITQVGMVLPLAKICSKVSMDPPLLLIDLPRDKVSK